jgi:hypothetical protein
MARLVRCPMRECRRSIDLDALPPLPARPEPAPCLHYIAAWGPERAGMVEEVLAGLAGNRELVIRNLRPSEVATATIEAQRAALEAAAREFAREVEANVDGAPAGAALFGDPHERDAVSRAMAQVILGPDPMVSRMMG